MTQGIPHAWIERALEFANEADADRIVYRELPAFEVEGCDPVRSAEVLLGLIAMAQATSLEDRGAAFDEVWPLEGVDPEHARDVTFRLYQAWFHDLIPVAGSWVHAFAYRFPSARLVDALIERISAIHDGNKQRRLVDALGWMDLPEAFFRLNHFAESNLIRTHSVHAFSVAQTSQKRFGYTWPEFQDMCMPTLGLDVRGKRDLDYGPRTVTMQLLAGEIVFRDSAGQTFINLPRARKADDADKVAALREELQPALKIFRENHERMLVRFERDMNENRRWSVEHVTRRLLAHPIVSRMLGGLVWNLSDRDEPPLFVRLDEEGQFIDLDLELASLEGVEVMRIAKPTDFGDALMPWIEHCEEFEIVQPIEQLSAARFMPGSPLLTQIFGEVERGEFVLDIRAIRRLHKDGVLTLEGHNDYSEQAVSTRLIGSGFELVARLSNLKRRWARKSSAPVVVEGLGWRFYSGLRRNNPKHWLESSEDLDALEGCTPEEIVLFFKTLVSLKEP